MKMSYVAPVLMTEKVVLGVFGNYNNPTGSALFQSLRDFFRRLWFGRRRRF